MVTIGAMAVFNAPRALRRCLLVAALLVGMSGCRDLTADQLVGIWVMTNSSRQYLPSSLNEISPTLGLNSDESFTATDLPDTFFETARVIDTSRGKGRWALVKSEGHQQVQLDFDGSYGTQLNVSGSGRATVLKYSLDDPDLGHNIEFRRG